MAIKFNFKETELHIGDTIKVTHQFLVDNKPQLQVFEGILIAISGREENKTFTVRKISADAVGVEKIWPVISPNITKIEVKKKGNARRAKLYFLRKRIGKEALKIKEVAQPKAKKAVKAKKSPKK
ncbi:MAG: 50S ribosomal protein L19 [Patescibacteria group bacterium]